MTSPRIAENDSDEGSVGWRSYSFVYLSSGRVDFAAGKVARRDVKRKWFVKLR